MNNLELYGLDFNNKIGTYFSFFHYSQSKQNFQMRTEFSLANRGSDYAVEYDEGTVEGTQSIWYVGIPVTAIINFPSSTPRKFYLGGGLSMNAALSGKERVTFEGHSESYNIYSDLNKLVVGGQFCAGVNLERSIIEVRYDKHFGQLYEEEEVNIYNDAFWLLIGIKFKK